MNEITIITNRVPRDVLDGWDLTEKERKDFDYLDWSKIEAGEDSASFFHYKGETYDLGDFGRVPRMGPYSEWFAEWDSYISDSFFSGILVKYTEDFEQIIVGRYYS